MNEQENITKRDYSAIELDKYGNEVVGYGQKRKRGRVAGPKYVPENDFEKEFIRTYPNKTYLLRMYREATGETADFGKVTALNMRDFTDYLKSKVAPNSARMYCATWKAFLNRFEKPENLNVSAMKSLTLKKDKVVKTYLTESELEKLRNYNTRNKTELYVKCRFLIGAYTGARHSDFANIDERNIEDGYLRYVSQKTHIEAIVPLKPIVIELIHGCPNINITDMTFNTNIQRICENCGIDDDIKVFFAGTYKEGKKYEFVTSHTARRSFATNLYLRGADIYSIMKMLGHSDVQMTAENYICCGLRPQAEKVMEYFK